MLNERLEKHCDPTIMFAWHRDVIVAIAEHWKEHARDSGIWKKARVLVNDLLWTLPESRAGEPLVNPLTHLPVVRPDNPASFNTCIRDCGSVDPTCFDIFEKWNVSPPTINVTQCIVCIGEGIVPYRDSMERTCSVCQGTGLIGERVLADW